MDCCFIQLSVCNCFAADRVATWLDSQLSWNADEDADAHQVDVDEDDADQVDADEDADAHALADLADDAQGGDDVTSCAPRETMRP